MLVQIQVAFFQFCNISSRFEIFICPIQ